MASFRCYDNSDVIAFLIMTNFHLYLIKLWWQFFQMLVYGDVVILRIGRYWPWKTVTVSIHLLMSLRPMLLHRMALASCRLYVSQKFGELATIFWANGLPPPPGKKFPVRLWGGGGGGVIATAANPPVLPKGLKCFHVLGLTCYFLLLLFIFFISRKWTKSHFITRFQAIRKIK